MAKTVAVLSVLPVLILGSASGPDPRKTGAPGDQTCAQGTCHVGAVNADGQKVEIVFPGGANYTPGVAQRLQVKVTGQGAMFGFQASARLVSNLQNGQAGTFRSLDASTLILCEDNRNKPPAGCPASAPLEFISHSSPKSAGTFEFEWVPPATDAGPVRVYVAGNAANGNGRADSGDRIYTANYELTPAAAVQKPAISQNGVVDAFSNRPLVTGGTWLSIYGSSLSATTREWAGSDFTAGQGPTTLDGVKVNIDGKPAIVRFVSPGQVNVQAPTNLPQSGPVNVEVINANGTSNSAQATVSKSAPVVLAPSSFNVGGRQYAVALYPDFLTYVGRANLIAGANFRPAKPDDVIILYGIGFGATNPAIPAGQIVTQLAPLPEGALKILFGQTPAQIDYAGLAPNYVGLYQFNVKVPNVADGDQQVIFELDGQRVDQTMYLTIQR
jgi:uncharacterized protein (TIGR03437 family)